jgi:glycosyltransferase involved in cell wall biosynthesis
MIAIIMCVYNGEKYLVEQLESVHCQTLPADEVTIYDDCSTDSTVSIICDFIKKHNLLNWHIIINPCNKGWRINFYDALSNCNGDYIFFCDQDDIWYPNKISTMINVMANDQKILVLNGIQKIVDSKNRIINNFGPMNIHSNFDYSIHKSNLCDNLIIWQNRIGATMLIRKKIKEQLLFFERNNLFVHDRWALNISSLMDGCYWIDFPAIGYRIHDNNNTIKQKTEKKNKKERVKIIEDKYDYLIYLYQGVKLIDPSLLVKNEYDNLVRIVKLFKIRLSITKYSKIYLWFSLFRFFDIFKKYFSIKQLFVELIEAFDLRDKYWLLKSKIIKSE